MDKIGTWFTINKTQQTIFIQRPITKGISKRGGKLKQLILVIKGKPRSV